ncbi:hypothetical protein V500_05176, partial [Pseudogymnoascus sp. VKM F-4518 (FW-2643)]
IKRRARPSPSTAASSDTLPDNDSSLFGKQDGEAYTGAASATKTESNVMRRVLTLSARTSNVSIGPPPDGGFKAWLQCAIACMMVTTTWTSPGKGSEEHTDLHVNTKTVGCVDFGTFRCVRIWLN